MMQVEIEFMRVEDEVVETGIYRNYKQRYNDVVKFVERKLKDEKSWC